MTRSLRMLVVGIAFVVAGVVLDGAGGVLWSSVDSDGRIVAPLGVIDAGEARTLVVDVDRYSAVPAALQTLGDNRLAVQATQRVFLAVGSTPDVDDAVRGSTYVVAHAAGAGWQATEVPGQGAPSDLTRQTFWWGFADSDQPEIGIPDVRPATVVITGPAGLGVVDLSAVFAIRDSQLILAILGGTGFALMVSGAVMIVLWARGGRSQVSGAT